MDTCSYIYLPPLLDNIPAELKSLPQWVAWKAVPNPKKAKPDKLPMNPRSGRGAGSTNSATWGSFEEAVEFYVAWQGKEHTHQSSSGMKAGPIVGIGFVLTAADPYVGIDLDHCVAEDGTVEPWAQEIINTVGSYTERSPSGTGVRIFVKGRLPDKGKHIGNVEIYDTGRYLTMTGIPLPGSDTFAPVAENQAGIDCILEKFIAQPATQDTASLLLTGDIAPQVPAFDAETLLIKIQASKQADKFNVLMSGDTTGYSSQSEADMALCSILAFWTGKNAEQMDHLFRRSGLFRSKWDEMHGAQTYGAMTIAKAIARTKEVYGVSAQGAPTGEQDNSQCGFLPPPPPVPLDAFPATVADLLKESASAFGVPLEIPVTCFLALLSCLVGRTRLIRIKDTWLEAGNLWVVIVAKSGMGKTPAMRSFFAPIYKREAASKKKYDKELEDYRTAEQVYKKQLAAHAAALIKPQSTQPAASSVAPKHPEKPKWKQAIANDATPEALADMLQANPKGILWLKDEFASLMLDMDKYTQNKGSTKSNLLSAYDCEPWKTNRASDPERNIFIPKGCVGIFGGVQPRVLSTLFQGGTGGVDEESGFLPRIAFIRAVAQGPSHFSTATLSAQSQTLLENIVTVLWGWDMFDARGNEIERIVDISDPAKAVYIAWYNTIEDAAHIAENSARLKKLQGQALRLCLLLHCLDAALAGTDGLLLVTEDTMRRALLLADWIREHQEQCWPLLTPGGKAKQASSLEIAVMRAVVSLSGATAAHSGEINNSELIPAVRGILGMPNLHDGTIGKAAARLGLPQWKRGNDRGRVVPVDILESFRATVLTASSFLESTAAKLSGQDSFTNEPPAPAKHGTHKETDAFRAHSQTQGEEFAALVGHPLAAVPATIIRSLADMWEAGCVGL